jgi:hypothetical protein
MMLHSSPIQQLASCTPAHRCLDLTELRVQVAAKTYLMPDVSILDDDRILLIFVLGQQLRAVCVAP